MWQRIFSALVVGVVAAAFVAAPIIGGGKDKVDLDKDAKDKVGKEKDKDGLKEKDKADKDKTRPRDKDVTRDKSGLDKDIFRDKDIPKGLRDKDTIIDKDTIRDITKDKGSGKDKTKPKEKGKSEEKAKDKTSLDKDAASLGQPGCLDRTAMLASWCPSPRPMALSEPSIASLSS